MRHAPKTVLFLFCLTLSAMAFGQAPYPPAAPAPAATAAAAPSFQSDFASDVEFVGKRLVDLASAVPADKYGWRPAPGVRSVSEVYMHVTGANYMLPSLVGGKLPEEFDRTMETKVTDKAKASSRSRSRSTTRRRSAPGCRMPTSTRRSRSPSSAGAK